MTNNGQNGQKCLEMAKNAWKLLEMVENGLKRLKMTGNGWSNQEWLEMAGNVLFNGLEKNSLT